MLSIIFRNSLIFQLKLVHEDFCPSEACAICLVQEDAQRKQPPACKFLEHCPSNFCETAKQFHWQGWDVTGYMTWPTDLPSQAIDQETHDGFANLLMATSHETAWAALKELSLVKADDRYPDGRLSLVAFRALMTSLCMVFILSRRQRGCTAICTCFAFTKHGTCCHELLSRYLHGDKVIVLCPMSALTEKNADDLQAADEEFRVAKRSGRPADLPRQSAWHTMKNIMARMTQRQSKKKEAKDEVRDAQWKLFRQGISSESRKIFEGQD